MSIVAFKRKSVIQYGARRSGQDSLPTAKAQVWMPQGPFGHFTANLTNAIQNPGPSGFSLNGPYRNVGYIGKSSHMSKSGTPFRGKYPIGHGGTNGQYPQPHPVFNVDEVLVLGDQTKYVKPSVVSTYGLLARKYRWVRGQYPSAVVKNIYTGNMVDSKSQGTYIHKVSTENMCVEDVNNKKKYQNYIICTNPTSSCYNQKKNSAATMKYNDMARNGPYTKTLYQPLDASTHIARIQRRCSNPLPSQQHLPQAYNGNGRPAAGTCGTSGGVSQLTNTSLDVPI